MTAGNAVAAGIMRYCRFGQEELIVNLIQLPECRELLYQPFKRRFRLPEVLHLVFEYYAGAV